MFKRFTERARRVIILAREEAERYHHEYLGTEHILLGILKDGGGIAITGIGCLGASRLRRLKNNEVGRAAVLSRDNDAAR
jgi:ATP-dependent Clp protease ATP-binding subunit ClpC